MDTVILAPGHRLRPRIMPIAAKQDAGRRPLLANMPHQPAQMRSDLDAGRRLARAQDHGDGAAAIGVVDIWIGKKQRSS